MPPAPAPDLSAFRHATPIQVRWGDLDALGHVNNATFLTYLEQARLTYFDELNLWSGDPNRIGLIMARVTIDYLLPLFAVDTVRVLTRTARLGGRSFDTHQLVLRTDQAGVEAPAANATITVVVYDYQSNQSVPIPAEWRAKLIEYEPAPIDGA